MGGSGSGGGTTKVRWFHYREQPWAGCAPSSIWGGECQQCLHDSLIQHDSDIVVKEEREGDMETGAPASSMASTPPKELLMWEGFKAGDPDDQCSQMSEESNGPKPTTWLRSQWGQTTGKQSLTSVFPGDIHTIPSPSLSSQERMTCNYLYTKHLQDSMRKWVRNEWGWVHLNLHPKPCVTGFNQFLYFSLC